MLEKIKKLKNDLLSWLETKKDRRVKRIMPVALMTAMILSIVLLTIFHSTDGFTTLVDTEFATVVSEKSTMTFTGYTLSNAKVLTSSNRGGVYYVADDGERVKPGDALVRVYENEIDENVKKLADELDRIIEMLEESIGDGNFTVGEARRVQEGISSLYYEMMRGVATGDVGLISSASDELLVLLNRKDSFSSKNTEELQTLLDEYRSERSKLETYYKGNYQQINSEYGGYFFRDTDGYEDIYTSKDIDSLTYDGFFEMTRQERQPTTEVGKVLLSYKWYVVVPTVNGISDTYSIGAEYDVSFPDSDSRVLTMQLEKIVYDESGTQSLMVFSCGTVDPSFDYLRVQQISIVNKNITGFRVPETAICEQGGSKGVFILKDGRAVFRKVTILHHGDGYYIVSSEPTDDSDYYVYLSPNDRIITDSKNMYDGKVIE